MKKYYLVLIVLQAFSFGLFAKQSSDSYTVLTRSIDGTPTLIKFNENSTVTHENFKNELISEFSFREEDSFHLVSNKADKLGFVHYKYNQTYKGIVVFGMQFILHEKAGRLIRANGKYLKNLNIDTNPSISKDEAVKFAMKSIGLPKYRWEISKAEAALKKKKKDQSATYYPKPVLVIGPYRGDYKNGKIVLCWQFNIAGVTLDKAWTVFIDAKTGELINKISLISNDVAGIGQTYYNGNQNIQCTYDSGSGYYLLAEDQRGAGGNQQIYTLTANNDSLPSTGGDVWNTSQYIGSTTTTFNGDPVANNVHWGIEQAYDFYSLFGRNSFDDNGTYILNLVHYDVNYNNAFWDGYDTVMCYGDGDGTLFDYVVGLDVEGHEFSHAITQYSAELQYQGESGALNESFSDILGTGIEWYVLGASSNWTIGEDIVVPSADKSCNYLRSLSNPNAGLVVSDTFGTYLDSRQPDTYGGQYWHTGDTVHIDSGVQNYWFYLLVNGGVGVNDNGDNFSVAGIGMSDALNIVYRNLTSYLTMTSDYSDAVSGSISSAIDFWGAGSQQLQSTIDAWCAVGLGTCGSAPVASFSANNTNICAGTCISFTDQSTNTPTSWYWSFPNGNPSSSTLQNPTNICYAASGTYSVTLTATNLTGSNTITSTNYITVNANSIAPTNANATLSTICSGSSTTLTVVGGTLGTGASWKWYSGSCGGTLVGTGSSITVTPSATTTYFVKAEGICNNTSCASITITLNTQSIAPTSANATLSTICPGSSTTLSVIGGTLGTGGAWKWYSGSCGGALVGTGSSITVTPSSTTTYYVRAEGICNSTGCASVSITLNTQSVIASSASANPNPVALGNSTTLSLLGGSLGTGAVWTWYATSCGGAIIGTSNTISFSPTVTGTYYVAAVGTCNTTSCESVTVQVIVTGIAEENILRDFIIFPNPTHNSFALKNISSIESFQLEIFNLLGEIIYKEILFGKNEYIVDANFAKGVYFVRVNDVLRKLVIE